MSIPLAAELIATSVGTYGVQVKQMSTGLWYDFSTSLFSATPVTPRQPLSLMSIAVSFVYFYNFTAPQIVAFTDGDYGLYYDDGTNTKTAVVVTVMNGSAVTNFGLDALAASHDTALTIGAAINAASAGGGGGGDTPGTTTLLTRIPGVVQPQTGDSFARIGLNGAGLTAIQASNVLASNGVDAIIVATDGTTTINLRQAFNLFLAFISKLDESIPNHSKSLDPLTGALRIDTTRSATGFTSVLTPPA